MRTHLLRWGHRLLTIICTHIDGIVGSSHQSIHFLLAESALLSVTSALVLLEEPHGCHFGDFYVADIVIGKHAVMLCYVIIISLEAVKMYN